MPKMLPAAPKTLGRLSDVFISALGAITGKSNRLNLPQVSKAVVILVDGLGAENLRSAAGHAPFLNAALKASKSINTVFPTTTAAAITSFGTGLSPSGHGVFGYSVFDRSAGQVRNLLSGWNESFTPEAFQAHPSVFRLADEQDVRGFTVGPGEYDGSGFTRLNMSGADYIAAKTFEDRVESVRKILQSKHKSLTYLYFPELDSLAHSVGVNSSEWLRKLEDLDAAIRSLSKDLSQNVGILLTADHGVLDVPSEAQIMLDDIAIPGLIAVTGDPRNTFLYLEKDTDVKRVQDKLREELADRVWVCTTDELKKLGWLNAIVENDDYLPDLFLISDTGYACYHRDWAKPQSLKMVGQHGGVSQHELSVPLLRFGAFAD